MVYNLKGGLTMFPVLYDSIVTGTVPEHYGIGVLKDALSCVITEERNGAYELVLKYPSSGAYADKLVTRAVIKAKPNFTDDAQLFRIYKIGKAIGSSFTVYARHISYDISGFPITTGSASSVGDALALLNAKAPGYTFSTDKSLQASFKIDKPSSVRSWFGGKAGSILDQYGPGDWKYDNFECKFLANRGQDRGVTIRYGKNLTKLENIDDSSNLVTSVMAFWQSSDDNPVTVISDAISTGATLDVTACQVVDASEYFENQPTVDQLNAYVNKYIAGHITNKVKSNIKLDFAQISKLLKDRVDLCDTVHIVYEDYGISATAKCIKTTWDVLQDKYTEIELGEARTNIADTIVGINKDLSDQLTAGQVKAAINDATDLITGNKGGYILLHDSDEDGYPDELLIMNTADISTATKVWRWNLSGLGYSSTGYSGPFGLAMTMDGAIVADYIKTGNLVFGGSGNTDGKLEIRDTAGNLICRFDKTGADVKGAITATSFDADAGDGNSYEILTGQTHISQLGVISGIAGYNKNNELQCGMGHSYVDTVNKTKKIESAVYAKDPSSSKAAIMRYICTKNSQNGFTLDMLEVGEYYSDSSRGDADASMQAGYNSDSGKRSEVFGFMTRSSESEGSWSLGVESKAGTTIGFMSVRTKNAYISGVTTSNGEVGLSLSNTDSSKIHMNGASGNINCISLTQTSSRKYKKNIVSLTDDEAKKILELRPVTYDFKDEDCGKHMRGFIAEEVDEVIPELVKHTNVYKNVKCDKDSDNNKEEDEVSLDYTMIIPYLTKMIQLQQKQIDELKNEIDKLKGEC